MGAWKGSTQRLLPWPSTRSCPRHVSLTPHAQGWSKGCTSCPCTCMAFSPSLLLPFRRWIPEFVRDADILHKLLSVSGVAFYLDESRGKRSTPASIASAAAAGSVAASPYVCQAALRAPGVEICLFFGVSSLFVLLFVVPHSVVDCGMILAGMTQGCNCYVSRAACCMLPVMMMMMMLLTIANPQVYVGWCRVRASPWCSRSPHCVCAKCCYRVSLLHPGPDQRHRPSSAVLKGTSLSKSAVWG